MEFKNKTNNTVYLQDIDRHIPFIHDENQQIDEDSILKSVSFQQMAVLGAFEIVSIDKTRIEKNLLRVQKQMATLRQKGVSEKTTHQDNLRGTPTTVAPIPDRHVFIKGHFLEAGGYAKYNRNLAAGLKACGVEVSIEAVGNKNQLNELEARQLATLRGSPTKNSIRIDSMIPSFSTFSAGRNTILYTTIESYTVPQQFIDIARQYREIWVTSDFCKEVLQKHGISQTIKVMPCSINKNIYTPEGEKYTFRPELNKFVFISVFGWSYRKGYDVLLRSYLNAFNGNDDVTLLLVSRLNNDSGKGNTIKAEIDKFIKESGVKNPPHIARCSKVIPEDQMPNLYRACNAFVLFSRGEGFGMPYCFKAGTNISTPDGNKMIENIKTGDFVYSHLGNKQLVTHVHKNNYNGKFCRLRTRYFNDSLDVTVNHRLLCYKPGRYIDGQKSRKELSKKNIYPVWIKASDINVGDYLAIPRKWQISKKDVVFDLKEYTDSKIKVSIDGVYIYSSQSRNKIYIQDLAKKFMILPKKLYRYTADHKDLPQDIKNRTGLTYENLKTLIPIKIKLSDALSKLFGYYIAEGSCDSGTIKFSFHSKEETYHKEVISLMKSIFGLKGTLSKDGNSANITFCSTIVRDFFVAKCGKKDNKKVPPEIFSADITIKQSFLNGWINGDGTSNSDSNNVSVYNKYYALIKDLQYLLLQVGELSNICIDKRGNIGYICSISGDRNTGKWIEKDKRSKKSGGRSYAIFTKNFILIPIKENTIYNDQCVVYNFDVDKDQSYISNFISAHNCEASLTGLPVIGTNVSGQSMFLNKDNSYLIEADRYSICPSGSFHVHYWDNEIFPQLKSIDTIEQAGRLMREVYENYDKAKERNEKLREFVLSNYSIGNITLRVKDRLEQIWSGK